MRKSRFTMALLPELRYGDAFLYGLLRVPAGSAAALVAVPF
jgi:hypothetical protein